MYITEKPDAGVVCFAFIVWKLDLVVVCAIWRIRLLLYMHDEKTQQFIFCSLSMHISQRNVPKGGCNRVDTTHTYTPARPFTRAPLDIIAVTAQDVPLPASFTWRKRELQSCMALSFRCGATFRLAPNSLVVTQIFTI